MSFKDWKARSELYIDVLYRCSIPSLAQAFSKVAEAAYKAGEREGMKRAEAIAANAILLREKLWRHNDETN